MRWSWKYAIIAALILGVEILIALFVRDRFVRPFMGDLLVVVLLYYGFRTILETSAKKVAIGVFIFAFGIELLQYFQFTELLGIQDNKFAVIIWGSTFDKLDLLAYLLGATIAYAIDIKRLVHS